MSSWSEKTWVPVERQLPTSADGAPICDGAKVAVDVLTVGMVMRGHPPETRGFHLAAGEFEDNGGGKDRVMFWAPCFDATDESLYGMSLASHG